MSHSNLAISASDRIPISSALPIDQARRGLEITAQKTQSIWGKLYAVTIGNLIKIVHIIRNAIGSVVRDAFFFPLKWSPVANKKWVKEQLLQIEEGYSRDFWDLEKPVDPSLSLHAEIRDKFSPPEDRVFPIQLRDGKAVEITCRIIQTKEGGDHFYNFAQIPGIFTTISNNIATTYPYLAAYLNGHKEAAVLPPARFIMISENNLSFKPATLDEAGFVMLETLKALKAQFGEIDQVVAHSLGTVFLANALKQAETPEVLPQHVCFDRGPTSIWEASKKYFCGAGRLVYLLAKCGRWASDIEQDVIDFSKKWRGRAPLLITGVVDDHHFSGPANLCLGEKVKKANDIDILVFNPPRQLIHEQAHHNLRADFFNPRYLVADSLHEPPGELARSYHPSFLANSRKSTANRLR